MKSAKPKLLERRSLSRRVYCFYLVVRVPGYTKPRRVSRPLVPVRSYEQVRHEAKGNSYAKMKFKECRDVFE